MVIRNAKRRGFSLLMVTCVIAVAGVLSVAMLSSVSLQSSVAGGQHQGVSADALAESGMNVSMYYLNNVHDSTKCPFTTLAVGSTWTRNANTLDNSVNGTYDLAITRQTSSRYRIVSKGVAGSSGGTSVSKTLTQYVDVNYTTHAATFSGNVSIPPNMTIEGNVYSPGEVSNSGVIKGVVTASSLVGNLVEVVDGLLSGVLSGGSGSGSSGSGCQNPDGKAMAVPNASSVNHYATYTYNGQTFAAKAITTASLINTTLGPTADNPAGIFIRNGTLDLNGNVKVNGTLVVMGGSLRVQGAGNAVTVTANNFPALVVDQDINFKVANSALDVTGLTWFGGKVVRTSILVLNSSLKIRGSMLNQGGNSAFDSNFGTISVKHERTKSQVAGLVAATPRPAPVSVTVVQWKNQN